MIEVYSLARCRSAAYTAKRTSNPVEKAPRRPEGSSAFVSVAATRHVAYVPHAKATRSAAGAAQCALRLKLHVAPPWWSRCRGAHEGRQAVNGPYQITMARYEGGYERHGRRRIWKGCR